MGEEMREQSVIADGMRIDWDMPIEMDDSVVVRADVFRPIDDGRYPVIMNFGGWPKSKHFGVGWGKDQWQILDKYPETKAGTTTKYANWEVPDPEHWVPHGYVIIRVDARGFGRSPGVAEVGSPRETKDFYNCIEWAATQPWCDGKVGLLGMSYFASTQWRVAALQPPHLAAICPWHGSSDPYRHSARVGGIFSGGYTGTGDPRRRARGAMATQHGMGERGPVEANTGMLTAGPETLTDAELDKNATDAAAHILAHPLFDSYWRERAIDWSKVTVPILSATNWNLINTHLRGNIEGYTRAASEHKWLEVHTLEYCTWFYTNAGRALQKRFFDYFLKGVDNGWPDQPPVQLQIRYPGDKYVERNENEWPIARTRWTKLYLDPSRRMLQRGQPGEESRLQYRALGEGVTFVSALFKEEIEITGPVAVKLFLSSSTTDADVFVILRALDADGQELTFQGLTHERVPLGHSRLRASHRKLDPALSTDYLPYHSHDELQLLIRGEVCELDVEVPPTSVVLPRGYRLALTLQGKSFVEPGAVGGVSVTSQDRPAEIFDNTHTVFGGGARGSYLLLPVIPPK